MNIRKLIVVAIVVLFGLSLVGCASSEGVSSGASGNVQEPPSLKSSDNSAADSEIDIANAIEFESEGERVDDSKLDTVDTFNGVTVPLCSKWEHSTYDSELDIQPHEMTYRIIPESESSIDGSGTLITETYARGETKDTATFALYTSEFIDYGDTFYDEGEWRIDDCTYRVMSAYNPIMNSYSSYLIGYADNGLGFATRFYLHGRYVGSANIGLRNEMFKQIRFDSSQVDEGLCSLPSKADTEFDSDFDMTTAESNDDFIEALQSLGQFEPTNASGSGDDVVDVPCVPSPCIMSIRHDGSSNFVVESYTDSGESVDLLVNTIGPYEGTVTSYMNFEETNMLEIHADGNWDICFAPLTDMEKAENGSVFHGDDVVYIDEASISKVHFSHSGESNFSVWAIGMDDFDLLVNEIGPYEGTVVWNESGSFFIVHADGDWSISW
ncbi:Uncharacterised protein [Slackia heliotrinireducens]|uniref:Lipoprotein n=1 Tax=Slackia heliotrinireducens (strain ATCC 29202 / DSM 20476 / NCTC 11029 / RHS 1) TaxID=471855 RepID=C7N5T7_SLAHD|nr:hypothetical protein [Slackia heliotrinireducens]ACV22272.1 hypothetical protein Shel_12440 [Slackia heliotrinireducens DSM 20476]VEH00445.1 Uncharacterised protein [Slackia heliotrinireducens]